MIAEAALHEFGTVRAVCVQEDVFAVEVRRADELPEFIDSAYGEIDALRKFNQLVRRILGVEGDESC